MKKRILTGDRPTGKLHLGHYVGSLANRVKLQDEYECFFIIADLHTLTTAPEKTGELKENVQGLVLDYLSVGIDPTKSTIYLQSQIPEVCELAVIFGMLASVPRLQRVPTLKDLMRDLKVEIPSFGLLGYPVLQAADILMVRADLVPVGRDQASHIEVTREIAREFNRLYPLRKKASPHVETFPVSNNVFPIPEALIGEVPILLGIDGQAKMSKSLGNVINLSDSFPTVASQVMKMYTDPTRIHPTDPGHIDDNPVFIYLDAFAAAGNKQQVISYKEKYKKGRIGDVEVKKFLIEVLEEFLKPIREKRTEFEKQPKLVEKILQEGIKKARSEAQKTLQLVREAMKIDY